MVSFIKIHPNNNKNLYYSFCFKNVAKKTLLYGTLLLETFPEKMCNHFKDSGQCPPKI